LTADSHLGVLLVNGGVFTAKGVFGASFGSGYSHNGTASSNIGNVTIRSGQFTLNGTNSSDLGAGYGREWSSAVSYLRGAGGEITASSIGGRGVGAGRGEAVKTADLRVWLD
jgi:hypothetical protein